MNEQQWPQDMPKQAELIKLLSPEKVPPVPHGMRKGLVYRRYDESGVSGTGPVVQICVFADGQCAYQWLNGKSPEIEFRQNFQKFLDIHVLSHPKNRTIIVWEDGEFDMYGTEAEVVNE